MLRSRKAHEDSYGYSNSDSDDERKGISQKTAQQQQSDRDVDQFSHHRRRKVYHDNYPSKRELKTLADQLISKVSKINNNPLFVSDAKNTDTIAVGLTNGKLVISGNVKKRRPTKSKDPKECVNPKEKKTKKRVACDDYGITKNVAHEILSEVMKSDVYKESRLSVRVIEQKVNPKDNPHLPNMKDKADDNAAKHAEMKTLAYCKKNRKKLRAIGISKKPCRKCHKKLNNHWTAILPGKAGTNKVTNWRQVDKSEVHSVLGTDRNKFPLFDSNVHLLKKKFTKTVKKNVKRSLRPGASVGLISGVAQIAYMIEKGTAEPYKYDEFMNAKAGSVLGILGQNKLGQILIDKGVPEELICGETFYANASVAEGRVGFGDVASIGGSALSAGAYAQYGWENSVGVYASVVRVDGNIGPVQAGVGLNFDCHASIGVNGVSASVLGFGFSLGPRFGIRTPFFDFSVTLF